MKSKMVPYKVGKTTKGGSLGKGTAVIQMADADLLFQLGGFGSVKELSVKLPEILKTLQSALDRSGFNITSIKRTTYTIQFKISIDKVFQEVDLLPIKDLVIKHPTKENLKPIYTEMKKNENLRKYHMKCLSYLQVIFVINVFEKLTYLKSLKVSWSKYVDPKNFNAPSAPYILDPAFPFHNLIRQKSGGIDEKYVHLERYAKKMPKELKDQDYRSKRGEL